MSKKTLVTSALPYANGALHLGHLAGAYLPADIYVRYLRLLGREVLWVCGSDEHGAAITMRAKKEGKTPREIIDTYHALNKSTFEKLGISFDIYHRTSDPLHFETSQEFFKKLYAEGDEFEERITEQYYDEAYDQFLADRYIKGTCPRCGHTEAYGDQCENCGSSLSPTELIEPISTLSGQKPTLKSTKHWYFRLNKHEDWLKSFIQQGQLDGTFHHNAQNWRSHVIGQCMSWLDGGLTPRAITRDLDWGIPVPLEEAKGKVLYVWFDAPIGYISATRQWCLDHQQDWKDWWQNAETDLVHFVGKDNIVFHCIIFPAMLKAHGKYNLPVNVPANQFLNFEGQKFSKSRNWGIEQHEYLEVFDAFPNKEDALRWTILRIMPENKDADFKWDEFIEYHDKDLADNLGNFVNRVLTLTHKYYEGKVPAAEVNQEITDKAKVYLDKIGESIEQYNFRNAAQAFVDLSSLGNLYLQESAPWLLYKSNPEDPAIATSLYTSIQIVGMLSIYAAPFLPFTANRLRSMLGLQPLEKDAIQQAIETLNQGKALVPAGHVIGQPEILFAKIDDKRDGSRMALVQAQKDKLQKIMETDKATQSMATPAVSEETTGASSQIQYEDFSKLDLRTATIIEASAVPKADKLLMLKLDLGYEQRTVVSGIALHYQPESIIGQKVLLLANLAPRKMRGVESQGMILMAENEEGKLAFVSPPTDWPNGMKVS